MKRESESCSMYTEVPTSLEAWMSIDTNYSDTLESWKLESLHGKLIAKHYRKLTVC